MHAHVNDWKDARSFAQDGKIAFVGYYPDGEAFSCEIDPVKHQYAYHVPPEFRGERRPLWR